MRSHSRSQDTLGLGSSSGFLSSQLVLLFNVFQQQFFLRRPAHLAQRVKLNTLPFPLYPHGKKSSKWRKRDEYVGVEALNSTEVAENEVNVL